MQIIVILLFRSTKQFHPLLAKEDPSNGQLTVWKSKESDLLGELNEMIRFISQEPESLSCCRWAAGHNIILPEYHSASQLAHYPYQIVSEIIVRRYPDGLRFPVDFWSMDP